MKRHNGQLLQTALLSEAAGSLRSPSALFMIAPQQNCGRYAEDQRRCPYCQPLHAALKPSGD